MVVSRSGSIREANDGTATVQRSTVMSSLSAFRYPAVVSASSATGQSDSHSFDLLAAECPSVLGLVDVAFTESLLIGPRRMVSDAWRFSESIGLLYWFVKIDKLCVTGSYDWRTRRLRGDVITCNTGKNISHV
jgi:hypothetical protein